MKKLSAKFLCVVLSFVVLLCALPVTVYAEGTTAIDVGSAEDLTAACNTINTNGGTYTINLAGDIENGSMSITKESAVVTVNGNGHTITNHRNAVNVSNGATVNLSGGSSTLTLQGSNEADETPVGNDDPGLIYVLSGSTCTMSANVTLKNHKGNHYLGGGVTVEGGTFVMNGGTIENCGIDGGSVCYGGGVAVYNGGYFEMNGGIIKDCYVQSNGNSWQIPWVAGGGVFVCRANFVMNDGVIENCKATNYETSDIVDAIGGGVAVVTSLDGVYDYNNYGYLDSNFTMNGGTIKDCSSDVGGGALAAGMAYINNREIGTPYSGSGSNNPGVYLNSGTMSGNDSYRGGAIFLNWIRGSCPVQIKNMTINNNEAYEGGAIEVYSYWTQAQIENCTIINNTAASNGGAIMLSGNGSSAGTHIKNTTIKNNTSGGRGAGVYYDANSKLTISGANTIQDNYYNGTLNNLNVLSKNKPVYVDGELTGSQIGLSDPTLWDDGKEDTASDAVSTDYLTSGYKANNPNLAPSSAFTSDHESWFVGYSDVNTNEVRLVRKKPNYHINNTEIANATHGGNDIFTADVEAATKEIKVGETIEEFYLIPEVKATESNSCPYIFKGWYYDSENDNDTHPVKFGTDKYAKDIYAHWIKVEGVEKADADEKELPQGYTQYGGFDLAGIQISEGIRDTNFSGHKKPGGLRFITSLNMDVVDQINSIKPDNIEYGYVAATHEGWINYHKGVGNKLQYVSETANGIKTSGTEAKEKDYFDFASNINCTSKHCSSSGVVKDDHRNFDGYLLYTLVITYEGVDDAMRDTKVLARPYIHYTDANGLERVAYSEYRGNSNTIGGCYISYNDMH